MPVAKYAMIPDGTTLVNNVINADETFTLDGYFFVLVPDSVMIEPGTYYNAANGLYYVDDKFKTQYGLPAY
ncbi:MAG: hypothetical protein ACTH8P_01045 [Ewingella sp.]|uniref:hypothetical protein n=1 Tax=Ewingella sp. TaxID=1897459 RepID=UPI003F932A32